MCKKGKNIKQCVNRCRLWICTRHGGIIAICECPSTVPPAASRISWLSCSDQSPRPLLTSANLLELKRTRGRESPLWNHSKLARWPALIAQVASFLFNSLKNYIDRRDVFRNLFNSHLLLLTTTCSFLCIGVHTNHQFLCCFVLYYSCIL